MPISLIFINTLAYHPVEGSKESHASEGVYMTLKGNGDNYGDDDDEGDGGDNGGCDDED